MSQHDYESKREIIDLIIEQSRHRRIVPFVGSGISFSTGFPTIAPVIQYLAKVDFAIRFGVYRDRFPPLKDGEKGQEKLVDRYRQHPSQYIRDFGWPNFGGLDADLWTWLEREATSDNEYKNLKELAKRLGINDRNIDELVNDLKGLKKPDHLLALQQWDLRREQEQREEGTAIGIKREWRRWKKWHLGSTKIAKKEDEPKLLYGDWEMLLDKLCEGDFGLVDRLFGELETGLYPAQAHRLLALLQPKLGIPLVLTTNFDSFLERAFTEAGLMPKVFDIHRNAELPDPILVERQLSVLKLHGSAYGLRFGERLRQKLETEARDYIKHYLPMKNELILVLGFSGSERRMMQMLQAIVENDDVNRENPRLIWIQGPGCPGPLFDELTAKEKQITYDKKKVRACEVKHADTFLQELYFKLASSHQALGRAYLSQSNQYLTELKLEVPKKLTKTEESCSLQVFVSKKIENVCSGSWATLAGTAFTQSLRQHRVIWIDLENHGTVESVIAEFFSRVKMIDPKSPSFNFSLLNSSQDKLSELEKKTLDTAKNRAMAKAVDRICDVFQRGKYVLVLDSLESFGRPPMVHHGIPNINKNLSLLEDFKNQVNILETFITTLSDKSNRFKDSYVVLTIDTPRQRHPSSDKNIAYTHLETTINSIIGIFTPSHSKKGFINLCYIDSYTDFYQPSKDEISKDLYGLPSDPIKSLEQNWIKNDKMGNSLERATHIYFFIKLLRVKDCKAVENKKLILKGVISAFVCFLSFFRRPRSIPFRHAIIDRWALRNILHSQLEEDKADHAHLVVEHLLDLLTLKESTVVDKVKDKNEAITFKADGAKAKIGEPLLRITESEDEKAVGIVAQRHEGGTIWMFREAHETTYNAITELLHLQEWINIWGDIGKSSYKGIDEIYPILDGMACISWHMHAARAYYVDIFLPTHDIKAFYEYLYHRVSALRTMTLLIAIIASVKKGNEATTEFNKVKDTFKALQSDNELNVKLVNDLNKLKNPIVWYADVIGVFSEDPDYDSKKVINEYNSDEANETPDKFYEYLSVRLISLRNNALETLSMALKRNEALFKANSIPEIMLSWTKQFLERELPEINGEVFKPKNIKKLTGSGKTKLDKIYTVCKVDKSNTSIQELKYFFTELGYMAHISKLDPESYIQSFNKRGGKSISINRLLKQQNNRFIKIKSTNYLKIQSKVCLRLLRCLIYQNPKKAEKFAGDLIEIIAEKFAGDLIEIIEHEKSNVILRDKKLLLRDIYALKAKCTLAKSKWCIWRPLRNRESLALHDADNHNELSIAEQEAIRSEDGLRIICSTKEEEAGYRSDAFAVRARTLYLREHFGLAHRFLDLASSGLQLDDCNHRSNAGIIHIIRAELLAISADVHFRRKLEEFLGVNEEGKKNGNEKELILHEVSASLKKIERAKQELNLAAELFGNIFHLRVWSIFLEFGQAQLGLEHMLFEIENLFLMCPNLDDTEYLKRSGMLEHSILNSMEKLRRVLDLLPFLSEWKLTKNEADKYQNDGGCYPMLIEIERMCYALWSDLYIVGAYYNSLLSVLSGDQQLQKDTAPNVKILAITLNIFSSDNKVHYLKRWKRWSHSMRFKKMGDSVDLTFSLDSKGEVNEIKHVEFSRMSLREKIIMDMKKVSTEDKIVEIWGNRRK